MRNGPSENYSQSTNNEKKINPEILNLSPKIQKTIDSILSILEKNPEKNKKIQEHFSHTLKNITNNPETQKLLDQKILEKMQAKIQELVESYTQWQITKTEAHELWKEVIQTSTKERLYVLQQEVQK